MEERVRKLNDRAPRPNASYVVYWAQMNRRVDANHGLAYAAQLANELHLPVFYYEGLTCCYPYASDRLHTFLLEGVPETARRLARLGIGYGFYLRRKRSDPNDVLYTVAHHAAAIVTDDYPTFIARTHNASVPARLDIPYYVVDSSCVVPMCKMEKREYAAYTIRPKITRMLPRYLKPAPAIQVNLPYTDAPPHWHTAVEEGRIPSLVASCEIDHSVKPSLTFTGGRIAAEKHLNLFLTDKLRRYARERNEPSTHSTSDISPYLHFGHINALEVALGARDYAASHDLIAAEFLEELIVRRELAFNHARWVEDPGSFRNLPDWAQKTLCKHAQDPRNPSYTQQQLERAETHDPLWNATQKEILLRGKIHGYYRMYWGKKIIEWSPTHQDALDTMIYLNDRYALDGRDPNTYANILWCFGLHDRPWQERPIFGMVRFMGLEGMKRKTNIDAYMREIDHMERTGVDLFRVR